MKGVVNMNLTQEGFLLKTKCENYICIRSLITVLVTNPFKATFFDELDQAIGFQENYFEQWGEELEIIPVFRTLQNN